MNTVTISLDNLEGSAASHHVTQGWAMTQSAVIEGLNPGNTWDTPTIYNIALNALISIVGDRGSPCPSLPVPTYLEQFIPDLISSNAVKIRIVYKGYPLPTYEFDGASNQVETNLNANGNQMYTQYTYPSDYHPDPRRVAGTTSVQGGLVSIHVTEPIFTVRFIVTAGTVGPQTIDGETTYYGGELSATEIMTWLAAFENCTNANTYTIGLLVGTWHQWKITNVRGSSKDGGQSYEASVTFQFRWNTWDEQVTFINPDTGKPPPDLIAGVGYYQPQALFDAIFPDFVYGPN